MIIAQILRPAAACCLSGAVLISVAGCGRTAHASAGHTLTPPFSAPATTTRSASPAALTALAGTWTIFTILPTQGHPSTVARRGATISIHDGNVTAYDLVNTYLSTFTYSAATTATITPVSATAAGYAGTRPADLALITEAIQQVLATAGHLTVRLTSTELILANSRYTITLTRPEKAPAVTGANLSWTPGMNHPGSVQRTTADLATATELFQAISNAPHRVSGTYACPADTGSKVLVQFRSSIGPSTTTTITLTGCAGPDGRRMTDRLQQLLNRLEPTGFHTR